MKIKEQIKLLAQSIMFDLNDDECEKIANEFNSIKEQLSLIEDVNVNDLLPTNFVNEGINIDDLNNDDVIEYQQDVVFNNCNCFSDGFVVIKNEK